MNKGNKLYSIFLNKCPRCQTGNFFAVNNPYDLKRFDQMNAQCLCCGERFEREPGYYTGALYVSYAYYVALVVLIVGLTPPVFRLARLTWINFFVSFDPNKPTHCP